MTGALSTIFLAWIFSSILQQDLNAGQYLAQIIPSSIDTAIMPAVFFVASLFTCLSIVSAWATISVMMPLAIPILTINIYNGTPLELTAIPILFPVIGAMAGALETKRLLNLSWLGLIRGGFSMKKSEEGMGFFSQLRMAASIASGEKVLWEGDETAGTLSGGQVIGGISDIPTVAELIERIVAEAEKAAEVVREKVYA